MGIAVKTKTIFVCQQCGASFPKWSGQCTDCNSWNTLVEEQQTVLPKNKRYSNYAGKTDGSINLLSEIQAEEKSRLATHTEELDRSGGR